MLSGSRVLTEACSSVTGNLLTGDCAAPNRCDFCQHASSRQPLGRPPAPPLGADTPSAPWTQARSAFTVRRSLARGREWAARGRGRAGCALSARGRLPGNSLWRSPFLGRFPQDAAWFSCPLCLFLQASNEPHQRPSAHSVPEPDTQARHRGRWGDADWGAWVSRESHPGRPEGRPRPGRNGGGGRGVDPAGTGLPRGQNLPETQTWPVACLAGGADCLKSSHGHPLQGGVTGRPSPTASPSAHPPPSVSSEGALRAAPPGPCRPFLSRSSVRAAGTPAGGTGFIVCPQLSLPMALGQDCVPTSLRALHLAPPTPVHFAASGALAPILPQSCPAGLGV